MLKIHLNKKEYNFLSWAAFLPNSFRKQLLLCKQTKEQYALDISEDQADEIRDLCAEQLQLVGFDKNYALTSEGKILDSLLDKFFVA